MRSVKAKIKLTRRIRNAYVSKIIIKICSNRLKNLRTKKKSFKNRFKELVAKEASKSPDVAVHTEETNIKTTNLTFQENPNPIEVKNVLKGFRSNRGHPK